jgi:hypothetical protein
MMQSFSSTNKATRRTEHVVVAKYDPSETQTAIEIEAVCAQYSTYNGISVSISISISGSNGRDKSAYSLPEHAGCVAQTRHHKCPM